ncbi:MAG TPA: hypothetical protein EYP51_05180 [Thiotrichales bacterium]|nr:hypothetical protein [Thiotrichales bacterium]
MYVIFGLIGDASKNIVLIDGFPRGINQNSEAAFMQYAGLTQVKRSISQQTLWLAPVLHRIGALLNVARTDLGIFLFVYPRS